MISDNAPEFPARNLTESEQLEFYRKRYGPMVKQINAQKVQIKGLKESITRIGKAMIRLKDEDLVNAVMEFVKICNVEVGKHGV